MKKLTKLTMLLFLIFIFSCNKNDEKIENKSTSTELELEKDFADVKQIISSAFMIIQRNGVNFQQNYSTFIQENNNLNSELSLSDVKDLLQNIKGKNSVTFELLFSKLIKNGIITEDEIGLLLFFDKAILMGSSVDKDLVKFEDLIIASNLNNEKKQKYLELKEMIVASFEYNNYNSRYDWKCVVGIAVVIGSGASGNPLGVIAGGLMIEAGC